MFVLRHLRSTLGVSDPADAGPLAPLVPLTPLHSTDSDSTGTARLQGPLAPLVPRHLAAPGITCSTCSTLTHLQGFRRAFLFAGDAESLADVAEKRLEVVVEHVADQDADDRDAVLGEAAEEAAEAELLVVEGVDQLAEGTSCRARPAARSGPAARPRGRFRARLRPRCRRRTRPSAGPAAPRSNTSGRGSRRRRRRAPSRRPPGGW